ncbi:MAG: HTH domain-containing protein, partial [Lachnospiraceae bacterium]|nr:HTH domain-containing protein [Lachnospiraceae bacterium]
MADEKLKILYLMQILLDETDKEHVLSATDLASRMDHLYHITCNRKTVYTDVEKLRSFGLKIEQVKGSNSGYYVAEREFELPELKLLVDAVQSAKFITTRKSEELIKKLEKMTSHENARQLQRQVYIYNRAKTDNETVYANVDSIHTATYLNRQISFKYCEWSVSKKLVRRKNGADYI